MKKLYYEHGKEFYWVSETPKTIKIEWVEKLNCDGKPLDQNVRWDKVLTVKKDNREKHCLKENDEDGMLIYPYQAGQPFYLVKATKEHIENEIKDCIKWGVSHKYYDDLLDLI